MKRFLGIALLGVSTTMAQQSPVAVVNTLADLAALRANAPMMKRGIIAKSATSLGDMQGGIYFHTTNVLATNTTTVFAAIGGGYWVRGTPEATAAGGTNMMVTTMSCDGATLLAPTSQV